MSRVVSSDIESEKVQPGDPLKLNKRDLPDSYQGSKEGSRPGRMLELEKFHVSP